MNTDRKYLDDAPYLAGLKEVTIIHGKEQVFYGKASAVLKSHKHVQSFSSWQLWREGGTGVTIIND